MSNFSTFFPASGGEGAGINSYAPFLVGGTDNPQGYNATTGLYTNPVDESVWLKTGTIVENTVTPNPYPNAFIGKTYENNLLSSLVQTGVPQSAYGLPIAADNRVGYKHIYYIPYDNNQNQYGQKAYKLDSNGVLIGSAMTINNSSNPNPGSGLYERSLGAGFSPTGNSGAGSIFIIYLDVGYTNMYVKEYSLDFQTRLNNYNLGTTPGGQSSTQAYVQGATYCQYTGLIYFTTEPNTSNNNLGSITSWNPSTNVFSGFFNVTNTSLGAQGNINPVGIATNPLNGQIAISNYSPGYAERTTYLYDAPSGVTVQAAVPVQGIENIASGLSNNSASWSMCWLDPNSALGSFAPLIQAISPTWTLGSTPQLAIAKLYTLSVSESFGDSTARSDTDSGQPLFIKLK
jgi:hypothetical protein